MLQQGVAERRDVTRVPGRDEVAVLDDLLVDPGGAGILQVGTDRVVRRDGSAADDVSLRKDPAGVADRRDRLSGGVDRTRERDKVLVGANLVRGVTARNHERIELIGADLGGCLGNGGFCALLAGDLLAGGEPDDHCFVACLAHPFQRVHEFGVFEQVIDDEGDSCHVRSSSSALGSVSRRLGWKCCRTAQYAGGSSSYLRSVTVRPVRRRGAKISSSIRMASAPATIRIQPMTSTDTPAGSHSMANVKMAPMASRKIPTPIPIGRSSSVRMYYPHIRNSHSRSPVSVVGERS